MSAVLGVVKSNDVKISSTNSNNQPMISYHLKTGNITDSIDKKTLVSKQVAHAKGKCVILKNIKNFNF